MSDDTKTEVIDFEQKKKEKEAEKHQQNIKELKKLTGNPYADKQDALDIFTEALERNKANRERLKKEREANNERTKRSYRIRPKKED